MKADQPLPPPPRVTSALDLAPASVGKRLDHLRRISTPERDEEARARLTRERPEPRESFAAAVERRLNELRALCALADYLHRSRGTATDDGG